MGESPSDPLGGDHSIGPWQRIGADNDNWSIQSKCRQVVSDLKVGNR